MIKDCLTQIICTTFEKNFGKGQAYKHPSSAMVVTFVLSIDNAREGGNRQLRLLLYAHQNYVAVYVKEDWNVQSRKNNTESQGTTGWKLAGYHDSCWRESVEEIIRVNSDRIVYLGAV